MDVALLEVEPEELSELSEVNTKLLILLFRLSDIEIFTNFISIFGFVI